MVCDDKHIITPHWETDKIKFYSGAGMAYINVANQMLQVILSVHCRVDYHTFHNTHTTTYSSD